MGAWPSNGPSLLLSCSLSSSQLQDSPMLPSGFLLPYENHYHHTPKSGFLLPYENHYHHTTILSHSMSIPYTTFVFVWVAGERPTMGGWPSKGPPNGLSLSRLLANHVTDHYVWTRHVHVRRWLALWVKGLWAFPCASERSAARAAALEPFNLNSNPSKQQMQVSSKCGNCSSNRRPSHRGGARATSAA